MTWQTRPHGSVPPVRSPVLCAAVLSAEPHLQTSSQQQPSRPFESTCVTTLEADGPHRPLYGRLSNVLGRRGANQLAVAMLFLGTLGCGIAPSMKWLIAARFVAGCGGGGIFTTASIITSDLYDMRSRSLTQGIASIFSGVSSVS